MKGKRDSSRRGRARSSASEETRLCFLRRAYMDNRERIEAKFLAMIRASDLSMEDRDFSLMSYREGAVEILGAVERIFGVEGVRDVSKHLRMRESPAADYGQDEEGEECDEGGEGGEGGDGPAPIDDTPWTYEKVDPKGVNPLEHLSGLPRFPLELVDKDEGEPSGPEPEDEEEEDESEEEDLELDIIERVANWEEVRGLWKDFDPAFR